MDQILHLGAGEFSDAGDYAGIPFRQVVLIEGDPDVAEKLSSQHEEVSNVLVISSLVTPSKVTGTFYRYNLPSLNGPLPPGDLQRIYTRLQEIDQISLGGDPLGEVLPTIPAEGDKSSLLILDVPGQETRILKSMREGELARFEWILLHGVAESLQPGSDVISSSIAILENLGYREIDRDEEDPQWPLVLLHRDQTATILRDKIREQEQLIIELTQERHLLSDSLNALKSSTSSILNERDATIAELEEKLETQKRDEDARVQTLEERLTSLGEDLSAKTERLSQMESLIQQQTVRLSEIETYLLENQEQSAEVTRQRDELQSSHVGLNEELENRARLLVEKETQIHQQGERIGELERVLGEVSAQRDALQGEVGGLRGQLEQVTSQQASLQTQISDLDSEVASKETLLDVLSKGRVQQDKMYKELSEERDGLEMQIGSQQARIVELEQQIQSRESKSHLVDLEFQKVEGQMDIIKEIFLRGNTLK